MFLEDILAGIPEVLTVDIPEVLTVDIPEVLKMDNWEYPVMDILGDGMVLNSVQVKADDLTVSEIE